jgi:sec-independent protein translocase protein TatB
MLDIGLLELLVIAVITLLVVGPERMPGVIRTVAAWIKRIKGFISSVQHDIEQDIQAEDIKKTLNTVKQTHTTQLKSALGTDTIKETLQTTQTALENTPQSTPHNDQQPTKTP